VGVFWVMELSGASALSAIVPNIFCGRQAVSIGRNACSSTHVLLAFSWISTIILVVYLSFLLCTAIVRQKQDPQIWHAGVREICRSDIKHSLGSTPNSPSLPRFQNEIPNVLAPQPRHPVPATLYAHRSGLGPEYGIEHYRPTSPAAERPVLPNPAAEARQHMQQGTRTTSVRPSVPVASLYPHHVQSTLPSQPILQNTIPSPPPLGQWPRINALDQPRRSKQKLPLHAYTFPPANVTSTSSQPLGTTTTSSSRSAPRSSRPSGPRTRSSDNEIRRPPPLDLTKISAFRSGGGGSGL